jgi:hypothetical protein
MDTADAECGFDTRELGAECICSDQCGFEAPHCQPSAAEPDGPSFCTADCVSSFDCPLGYGCFENACQFCSVEPGMVSLGGECFCDSDCAPDPSGATVQCPAGVCERTSCAPGDPSSCEAGFGCEQGPGATRFCAECASSSSGTLVEGAACGCSEECTSGLVCRSGACRRPCASDADCDVLSCVFRTTETPSCQPAITTCATGDGSRLPGQTCTCNADCGAGTFCLLGAIGTTQVDRCSSACVPASSGCPIGTRCCSGEALSPSCLPDDVIASLSDVTCDP